MTAILGISAFYHDSAAALLVDGEIVAAAQEERFSRKKNDESFPVQAIAYCLESANLRIEDLDYVGFYDKALLRFERLLETYMAFAPRGFASFLRAMPKWLNGKIRTTRELSRGLRGRYRRRFVFPSHHESHAASAFFPSPFEEAAILTLDGVGEWATASYGCGRGNKITLSHELHFPHSLGLLYSAFTYYCGFQVNEGEYKLMGLAPYGEPSYVRTILEHLIDLKDDGSFRLDLSYFNYCVGLTMTSEKFHRLFGGPPRRPSAPITQRDMDIASSIQKVTEEVILHAARHISKQSGLKNVCLAGGVALNCVANGRILREGPFERIWVQPAAGDAGGALGVAEFIWHQLLDQPRSPQARDSEHGSLLGPSYDDKDIFALLERVDAAFDRFESDEAICKRVSGLLAEGKVVGWFQGRMEFGPRALGARSILADPRRLDMQSLINRKVKFREGFRPFAPAVLRERANDYFDVGADVDSPYMLVVVPLRKDRRVANDGLQNTKGFERLKQYRSSIQAVTHVDYSARIQTVDKEPYGIFRTLLEAFFLETGCPVLVNTSLNLAGEPIVCTPMEAYATFMSSDIDVLCIGHAVVMKERQRAWVPPSSGESPAPGQPDPLLAGLLASPRTFGADLRFDATKYVCTRTETEFAVDDGVPLLFWPREGPAACDVVRISESTAPPPYNEHDSVHSLFDSAGRDPFAKLLYQELPFNSTVLEVGCSTGGFTNFLALSTRRVIGTDVDPNALRLAETFRREQGLLRARFVQMNPLRPCFRLAQFDVIICNGPIGNRCDTQLTLTRLSRLVKPGGHVVVRVCDAFARLAAALRRDVLKAFDRRDSQIDKSTLCAPWRKEVGHRPIFAVCADTDESSPGADEVLRCLQGAGLEFVRAVSLAAAADGPRGSLLQPTGPGTPFESILREFGRTFASQCGPSLLIAKVRKN